MEPGVVMDILGNLDIRVVKEHDLGWDIEVPPYRVDVTREADVCEWLFQIFGAQIGPCIASSAPKHCQTLRFENSILRPARRSPRAMRNDMICRAI